MVDSKEDIVRVLFPNKVLDGRVLGGAFVLRSLRQETHMSVFRIAGKTFVDDISKLDAGRNLYCCVLNVSQVRSIKIVQNKNYLNCDVIETGDITVTSHAGIFTTINGQQLIGGHESEIILYDNEGTSMDALVLAMQHRLATIAQKRLTKVNEVIRN